MWMDILQFFRTHLLWEMLFFIPICVWIAERSKWTGVVWAARILAMLFITMFVGELALRTIDPWRGWAYQQNVATFRRYTQYHATRGYALVDGTISWTDGSQATIRDGVRWTPDSQDTACQIAVIGDSVTFGFAVHDEAVYVDRLARRFPGATWTNQGVPGYDHPSLRAVYDETPADGYVYLFIANDPVAPGMIWYTPSWSTSRPVSALRGYEQIFVGKTTSPPNIYPLAWENLSFVNDPRVLSFTVDVDLPARYAAQQVFGERLIEIPLWTESISVADGHPSAAGHAQLAASMEPYVEDWLPTVCGAVAEQ